MAITATLVLENGQKMVFELYPHYAPNTVNNFATLANAGYYDGLIFHRIIENFMVQGGCPDGTGMGGPGYKIKGEFIRNGFKQNTLKHNRGVISMARSALPNSAGSQFFIMHKPSPHLDGDYAAFGQLIEGDEVLEQLATVATDRGDRPLVEQKISSIRCEATGEDVISVPEKY